MLHRRPQLSAPALLALVLLAPLVFVLVRAARSRAADVEAESGSDDRAAEQPALVAAAPAAPAPGAAPATPDPLATELVAADVSVTRRGVRVLRGRRRSGPSLAMVLLALVVFAAVPTTWATFTDQVTMAPVSVGAGTVNVPTGLTATQTATAARLAWTAPATGLSPDGYDVYRSTTAGSYGAALATGVTSPYDDTTAAQCTPYFYSTRSKRVNLASALGNESTVTIDRTAPVVASGHAYFDPTPLPKVVDFVRVSGGNVELYANVTDNCSATGANLTVRFNLGAPLSTTLTATYNAAGYTPVGGGTTYNYKYGPYALAPGALTNGQTVTLSVTAIDDHANSVTTPATPFVADGAAPALTKTSVVSAYTNFYDSGTGIGEVNSNAGNATVKAAGFYVYGDFTDASGISSMTGNVNALRTGSTAVPLVAGSYTTDNGVSWPYRSAATVSNVNTADSTQTFTITATDVLGNVATTPNQSVAIDNTPIAAGTASCTNTGNASNTLNVGDLSDLIFGDTFDPASLRAAWTAPPFTTSGTAVFRQGTRDYFDFNTDFGMTMFSGTAYNAAYNMNATNWVTVNVNVPSTTIALVNATTVRVTYGNPATAITDRAASAQMSIGTSVRDAAGNPVAAAFTEACTTSAW